MCRWTAGRIILAGGVCSTSAVWGMTGGWMAGWASSSANAHQEFTWVGSKRLTHCELCAPSNREGVCASSREKGNLLHTQSAPICRSQMSISHLSVYDNVCLFRLFLMRASFITRVINFHERWRWILINPLCCVREKLIDWKF